MAKNRCRENGGRAGQKRVTCRGRCRPDTGQEQGRNRGGSGEKRNGSREKKGGVWRGSPGVGGWQAGGLSMLVLAPLGGGGGGGYRGSCRKPFAAAWSGEPVRLRGLEWGRKHTRWAYTHALDTKTPEGNGAVRAFESGGQGRNRTTDTRIFSPLLYQLSYLARELPAHTGYSRERDYRRNFPSVKRLLPFMRWPRHTTARSGSQDEPVAMRVPLPLQKSTRRRSQPGRPPVYCPHEYM